MAYRCRSHRGCDATTILTFLTFLTSNILWFELLIAYKRKVNAMGPIIQLAERAHAVASLVKASM